MKQTHEAIEFQVRMKIVRTRGEPGGCPVGDQSNAETGFYRVLVILFYRRGYDRSCVVVVVLGTICRVAEAMFLVRKV